MQYSSRRDGGRLEVTLSGRLTFADSPQFPDFVDHVGTGFSVCEIDLAGLTFIDSTGMSLFVHVYDAAQASGFRIIVRNAKGMVAETLRRASFDTLFEFK